MLSYKLNGCRKLFLAKSLSMAEYDGICAFNLIVEEFTEVLHIHLALFRVNNSSCGVESDRVKLKVLYRFNNVGQLTNSRGLDNDSLRLVGVNYLLERLAEIANQ